MIPLIQQTMLLGMTASQILTYISRKFKSAAAGIQNAQSQGYSNEDILKYLGGKIKPHNKKKVDEQLSSQEKYLKSVGIKSKEEKEETRNKFLSGALGVGAAALGAYELYKGFGGSGSIQPNQPGGTPPVGGPPPAPPLGPQTATQVPATPAQQLQLPTTQQISPAPQPGPTPQPGAGPVPTQPISPQPTPTSSPVPSIPVAPQQKASEILKSFGQDVRAKNLLEKGMKPEDVSGVINKVMKGDERKRFGEMLKSGQTKPLIDMVKEYQQEIASSSPVATPQPGLQPPPKAIQEVPKEEPQPARPLVKKDIVATPDGVGEVKSLGPISALVEIDGKIKNIPLEELTPEKEYIRKAKLVFDPSQISEKDRSGALGMVYKSPDSKAISMMYGPSGKFYRFRRKDGQPIKEEDLSKIREGITLPITSGDTWMGSWNADDADSRGAHAYAEFQKKSQDPKKIGTTTKKGDKIEEDPSKEYWVEEEPEVFTHGFFKSMFDGFQQVVKLYGKAK